MHITPSLTITANGADDTAAAVEKIRNGEVAAVKSPTAALAVLRQLRMEDTAARARITAVLSPSDEPIDFEG